MGLLTRPTTTDPRLIVGAYLIKGRHSICMYRVSARTSSQVVLEDAWTEQTLATTISDILANYDLVPRS